jgi:hypothetical protein
LPDNPDLEVKVLSQILRNGTAAQRATLFNLFPIKALRGMWNNFNGDKPALSQAIAEAASMGAASQFLHEHLLLCKQHIYVFNTNMTAAQFAAFEFTELDPLIVPEEDIDLSRRTFLTEIEILAALWIDPPERRTLKYLLPLRIEFFEGKLLVRFVKFEKNFTVPGVDAENVQIRKHDHENDILLQLERDITAAGRTCEPADLHRAIKHLWHTDAIDAFKLSYSTPDSVDTKKMNDNRGLKQYNRPVYDGLRDATFFTCLFKTLVAEGEEPTVFTVNLTTGFISFNTYSERGEADALTGRILECN